MSEPMPKDMEELLMQILTDIFTANVELGNLKQGYEKITQAIPLTQDWMQRMEERVKNLEQTMLRQLMWKDKMTKFGDKVMMTGNRLNALIDRLGVMQEQLERMEAIVMAVRPSSEEEEEEEHPPSQ